MTKFFLFLLFFPQILWATPLYQAPNRDNEAQALQNVTASDLQNLPVAAMVDQDNVVRGQQNQFLIRGTPYKERMLEGWDPRVRTGGRDNARWDSGTEYTRDEQGTYRQASSARAPLCPGEPFYEENIFANCTGFLVAPQVLVTAAHCLGHSEVEQERSCRNKKWAFGLGGSPDVTNPSHPTLSVAQNQVYSCRAVYRASLSADDPGSVVDQFEDYAVIILDRPVEGRLPFRKASRGVSRYNPTFMYGHPMGLPLKAANLPGATSTQRNFVDDLGGENTFYARVDQFPGNSGSPLLSRRTQGGSTYDQVEGILVEGTNFHYMLNADKSPPCMEYVRCYDETPAYKEKLDYLKSRVYFQCRGERAVYIDRVRMPTPGEVQSYNIPLAPPQIQDRPRDPTPENPPQPAPGEDEEVWELPARRTQRR